MSQRVDQQVPQALSCRALGVSPAWFYKWRDGDPSTQHARREKLKVEIRRLFAAHNGQRLKPGVSVPFSIGDMLRFGSVEIAVQAEG